jgi:iron complex transport system ATP-binding protein
MSLAFSPAEFVCIVGPNGSGKSTLLKTLAGHLPPLSGGILQQGKPLEELSLRERAQQMALVLTRFSGAHGMSAFDSVALGRSPHTGIFDGLSSTDKAVVISAMEQTDSLHLKDRGVEHLSDGERQRLAVARALAQEARIILLDEPTAFLDLSHRVGLMGLLRSLCRTRKIGVLLSTHDLDLALRFADRILVLDGKGGFDYGVPETLALGNVFDRVFSSGDVVFDLVSGSFRLQEEGCIPVNCAEGGVVGAWTRRALRRKGFRVEKETDFPKIEILESTNGVVWQLSMSPTDLRELFNLEALLDSLNNWKM